MKNIIKHTTIINKIDKNHKNNHKSPVIWLTGLSASGKSTIANYLEEYLFKLGVKTHILDGDNVRCGLNTDLSFSDSDRKENMRRIAEVAKLFSDSGTIPIVSFISPFQKERELCKGIIGDDFIEVFVNTSLTICESRDPKGLYQKARNGEIKNFTGIDSPYEEPTNPDLILDTEILSIDKSIDMIINYLSTNQFINEPTNGWFKTNHGGTPTNNKGEKKAIFIGRYQPYHQGHISLIQQKLDKGIKPLILIRDIEPDIKNPFTTTQTRDMILKYHKSKGEDVEVLVIPDIESVNYGRGVGYEINEFTPPSNISWVSATKIRESINCGSDNWKVMVDKSIQEDVINHLITDK